MIVKSTEGYHVKSADGLKNLGGPYKTQLDALKRLKQVDFYKNKPKKPKVGTMPQPILKP